MTTAEESARAGKLDEALADLQTQVRRAPADPRLRIFLFQLLALRGQWERAMTQLQVVGELDAKTLAMVQTYREALRCEALRAEVFAGKRSPLFFGQPAEWMALLLSALKLGADDRHAEAQSLRERAFELAPATPGELDGLRFSWIADADQRIGPMLEAIVNGRYYWVPFHRLKEITLEKPTDLRDFAWLPAELTFANGGQSVALIPTRYPGSETAKDPRLPMARLTEWEERAGGLFVGLGQRILATDHGEYGLLDVRTVKLESTDEDAGAGAAAEG